MKAGTIFDHPTKDGGVVRLKAVEEVCGCDGCIFGSTDKDCETESLKRDRKIAKLCGMDKVTFAMAEDKLTRIMEAVRNNTESYGEEQDAILEELISKILEE